MFLLNFQMPIFVNLAEVDTNFRTAFEAIHFRENSRLYASNISNVQLAASSQLLD